MPEYLVFTLAGPMGAFGDVAGHERRGTALWPGRSAILGLIGAAMGVRRDDAAGLSGLEVWKMAVATLSAGRPLRDFHTVQAVPSARIKAPNSRRAALAALKADDNPVITTRDYLTDCLFAVALWGGAPEPVAEALRRPIFVPYLGRKACPLSMPMCPRIVDAPSPVEATALAVRPAWASAAKALHIASDPYDGATGRRELRWDQAIDRTKWHFAQREVIHVPLPEDTA